MTDSIHDLYDLSVLHQTEQLVSTPGVAFGSDAPSRIAELEAKLFEANREHATTQVSLEYYQKRSVEQCERANRMECWTGELQRQVASLKLELTDVLAENARLRRGKR